MRRCNWPGWLGAERTAIYRWLGSYSAVENTLDGLTRHRILRDVVVVPNRLTAGGVRARRLLHLLPIELGLQVVFVEPESALA